MSFVVGAASQAGDTDSYLENGPTSVFQGSTNVVVLYCLCYSDSASVRLYFIFNEKNDHFYNLIFKG